MSNYTPGPWKAFAKEKVIQYGGDKDYGGIFIDKLNGSYDEIADMHLIAAAPELLEAAKFALAQLKPEQTEAISLLKGAIGKAERVKK